MKIVFMGTPDFARDSLEAVYNKGYEILGVVTNPDRPKGRGMKMVESPVKQFAVEHGIPIYQPDKVRKNEEFLEQIKSLKPDVICVVAYGKILPKEILDIPQLGSINVHGSLLPQYRGAAPIQWAVLNGDKKTGVTTMYMDIGMDEGDMILKREVEIGEEETTGELWGRLSKIGGELLVETLEKIQDGTATRQKQGDDFSVAPMLNKQMAEIDWNKTANEIHNLVRGLNPIMGAYFYYNGKKLKLWKVKVIKEEEFLENFPDKKEKMIKLENGNIIIADIKLGLYIKANGGILQVLEIQGENAKKMNVKDFLNGNKCQV